MLFLASGDMPAWPTLHVFSGRPTLYMDKQAAKWPANDGHGHFCRYSWQLTMKIRKPNVRQAQYVIHAASAGTGIGCMGAH